MSITYIDLKTPHKDKLDALFKNKKLPRSDSLKETLIWSKYNEWIKILRDKSTDSDEYLSNLVKATNKYKNFIDLEFIFNSDEDFLYRQKGQLKLDNTILEECLPYLIDKRLTPGAFSRNNLFVGDESCYAGLYFGNWQSADFNERIFIKSKNQDFAVGKEIELNIKDGEYENKIDLKVAYFAAELKTNLDKTMFQEASATARELKSNVQNSVYVLICEWLDMTPIDSGTTSIDKIIVLRKAKRLNSNVRASYSNSAGRKKGFNEYKDFLTSNPLDLEMFKLLSQIINNAFPQLDQIDPSKKIKRGFF